MVLITWPRYRRLMPLWCNVCFREAPSIGASLLCRQYSTFMHTNTYTYDLVSMFAVDVPIIVSKQWIHLQRLVSGAWWWKTQLPSVTSPAALLTDFHQEGKRLLNTKHEKPVMLCSSKTFVCVCVCVASHGTWREDVWVEAHLKDDVANWAHFFTSSSYCLSGSSVTYKQTNMCQV